jgi:hypothetical protein
MPALLPIILTASHLVLAADRMPEFNIDPTCRPAAAAAIAPNRDASACKRDELTARDKLNTQWGQFAPAQQEHCVALSKLGGAPSYVELLTCLELAKAAQSLPAGDRMTGQGTEKGER